MKHRIGSILQPMANAIAHQCNCVTRGPDSAKGLTKMIFKAFPYSDVYLPRRAGSEEEPGSVRACGKPAVGSCLDFTWKEPMVFALMGQRYPGPSKRDNDHPTQRVGWMRTSLIRTSELMKDLGLKILEVPYGIGCGLAAGRWDDYLGLLSEFEQNTHIEVVVVTPEASAQAMYEESKRYR